MPQLKVHDGIANRILLSLPLAALKPMRPALELINMARGQVLAGIDRPIKHLYFVNRGLVSLLKTMRDGRTVEIEAVGIEGVSDPCGLFGVAWAILESVVEIPGEAFRSQRNTLADQMSEQAALREVMQNYTKFTVSQLVQTAACNRLHSLEERYCRWLLIAHDSALTDSFPLTHEFLALILGVHRSRRHTAKRRLSASLIVLPGANLAGVTAFLVRGIRPAS
jgi:CRP-like cAMP-binding protein